MNNKYLKMMGAGLFVVALVAWRQSIITMEKDGDQIIQEIISNSEKLPDEMHVQITQNLPLHPFYYVI
jgi:hypothetical protein